jgi:hypothetical protein
MVPHAVMSKEARICANADPVLEGEVALEVAAAATEGPTRVEGLRSVVLHRMVSDTSEATFPQEYVFSEAAQFTGLRVKILSLPIFRGFEHLVLLECVARDGETAGDGTCGN